MTAPRTWRIDNHCPNAACEWQIVTCDGIDVGTFRSYPAATQHIRAADTKEVGR